MRCLKYSSHPSDSKAFHFPSTSAHCRRAFISHPCSVPLSVAAAHINIMANPYQYWNHQLERESERFRERYQSEKSNNADFSASGDPNQRTPPSSRGASIADGLPVCARSVAFGSSVAPERGAVPVHPDKIIIVIVRLTTAHQRSSVEGCDQLPSREVILCLAILLSLRKKTHLANKIS